MRKLFPFLLIAVGLALILAGVGYWRFGEATQNPAAAPLPDQVANLSLTSESTGRAAVQEVTRMHGKGFPLVSAAVGNYGAQHQVTLWVSGAPISSIAGSMLTAMRDKIAEGRSPFTALGERADGSRVVYELEGMGQRHYYFQSGALLVWMAADPALAEQALSEILKFYP